MLKKLCGFIGAIVLIAAIAVRRLVEYIRVMKDNSIIIVLKGGIQIREPIETNN